MKSAGHQTIADNVDEGFPPFYVRQAIIVGADRAGTFQTRGFFIVATIHEQGKTEIITVINEDFSIFLSSIIDMVKLF